MKDLVNNLGISYTIAPVTVPAAQTALVVKGTAVDLQGYEAATIIIPIGAVVLGDASATTGAMVLQESDTTTDGDFAAPDAADVIAHDTLTGLVTANVVLKCGYIGKKRYVRVVSTITTGGTTGAFPYAALIVKGEARSNPVG